MRWEEELDHLLAAHGVVQEQPSHSSEAESRLTIVHRSSTKPGVVARLDLIEEEPHLRLLLPIDDGPYKINLYQVRLAPNTMLTHLFSVTITLSHTQDLQEHCTRLEHALLQTYGDLMEALFWQGDLNRMQFPPEILVRCLL